jgi:hypothetical protein
MELAPAKKSTWPVLRGSCSFYLQKTYLSFWHDDWLFATIRIISHISTGFLLPSGSFSSYKAFIGLIPVVDLT